METTTEMMRLLQELRQSIDSLRAEVAGGYKEKYEALAAEVSEGMVSGVKAAEIIGCSPAMVTKLRKEGKLKGKVVGKTWRYPVRNILKYKFKML